ncbi:MAG TPA: hypothetical protein VN694_02445 [Caulobacteraceae bacterium]|nr:hypothetical protein [Caulobacteraceae bacterium]
MTAGAAGERRFLSQEELTVVGETHYPQLAELDAGQLREARTHLRDLRDKARTVAVHKRREARGKGPPRAAAASGDAEHASRRKQIFSQALKRTNHQLERIEHAEARARTFAGHQKALALVRRAELAERPPPGRHAHHGMRSNPSLMRARGIDPAMAGRVSQAGKAAQARRDA